LQRISIVEANIISRVRILPVSCFCCIQAKYSYSLLHRRSIRFDDKKREDSCTSRVLIVFSRKPPDVMEYRRSERRIMSKTNEARRNKRAGPFLASRKGSRWCCCPARKMEGEFSRARPLVKSSHSPLPSGPVAAALRPSSSRVRQKGRERATKGGKVRRETTAGRYDETTTSTVGVAASGDEADQYFCTQAPSGSGPWYHGTLAPPGSDILNSYLCYCQNLYICLSMNKFEGSYERLCDLSKQTLLREIRK